VDDLIAGITALMNSPDDIVGPINLGNPCEFTVLQLAEKVRELTGSSSEILFQDLPQDDPIKRCPDISKARTLLNWEPRVPLEEGLQRTIDYFDRVITETKLKERKPPSSRAAATQYAFNSDTA